MYANLTKGSFSASTIPRSDPTMQWVVESGSPSKEPQMTAAAVANCAQKPLTKFSLITFLPTVSMTLYPRVRSPAAIPILPTQYPALEFGLPFAAYTMSNGVIALATSLEP